MIDYTIRKLSEADLPAALELAWQVFYEFEAAESPPEGVEEFHRYVDPDYILGAVRQGKKLFWGCYAGDKAVGMLGLNIPSHISLLFVDEKWHGRGIAKALLGQALAALDDSVSALTVNSSPYAVEIYKRMGFLATDTEQLKNGLRFTPMKKTIPGP